MLQFATNVIWLDFSPLVPRRADLFHCGTIEVKATVTELSHRVDLGTLELAPTKKLELNESGRIRITLDRRIPYAPYAEPRDFGGVG